MDRRLQPPALLEGALGFFPPFPPAGPGERAAFRQHILSSIWGGISTGIVLLADVILAKTLGAAGWHLTVLATLGAAANLLSFYWAGWVQGRRKSSSFLLAVLIGRLPLFLLLGLRTAGWMLAVNFLYSVGTALLITSSNALFQTHYPEPARAVRFGIAVSVATVFSILSSLAAGAVLERWEESYPWLFAGAAVAGLLSAYHLHRMEGALEKSVDPMTWFLDGARGFGRQILPAALAPRSIGLAASLQNANRILKENPGFVRFERDYMIYGFGFLGLVPVLPLYIVRDLNMNYHQLSATKGLWAQVGLVLLSPLLGLALSRLRPLRFTGRAFLLLAGYPFCLLLSTFPGIGGRADWVYAGLLIFSVAMAGVNLSWTLGSMHFAGDQDASVFQGLHVGLTGVRGLLAPSLGYGVQALFGYRVVFVYTTILFALAGILMLRHDRDERRATSAPRGVEEIGAS